MRVILQAGHSADFAPFLPFGGGAPGEAAWTGQLAVLLAGKLRARGIEVDIVGTWAVFENGVLVVKTPPQAVSRDADLFVSLHYDAAIYHLKTPPQPNSGCIIARAALDPMAQKSDEAIAQWIAVYPERTGIPLHQERVGVNMTYYYGFQATTPRTPGIILEHGVGQGLDHTVLFEQIDLVAEADAKAILAFLGIEEQVNLEDKEIADAVRAFGGNAQSPYAWVSQIGALQEVEGQLRQEVDALKASIKPEKNVSTVIVRYDNGMEEEYEKRTA